MRITDPGSPYISAGSHAKRPVVENRLSAAQKTRRPALAREFPAPYSQGCAGGSHWGRGGSRWRSVAGLIADRCFLDSFAPIVFGKPTPADHGRRSHQAVCGAV